MTRVRRAAFDIGSGATKVVIADVDLEKKRVQEVLLQTEVPVPFALDWKKNSDNCLSQDVQSRGLEVLKHFLDTCDELGVDSNARCAVATEVFRKAANGKDYLAKVKEQLGLSVEVVSQTIEAELGYLTAVALQEDSCAETICWDSGGASFQITRRTPGGHDLEQYVGAFGTGVVTEMLVNKVQGRDFATVPTANPVEASQAKALVDLLKQELPSPPSWLRDASVTAIGGPNAMFCVASEVLQATTYDGAAVWHGMEAVTGLSDEEMSTMSCCSGVLREPPGLVVSKLCLLTAVIEHCGIREVHFVPATGSCQGLLISEEHFRPGA